MSEFLAAAAQAMNAPEVLVQRSADARAKATGTSADDILKAWAGGEAVAPAQPAAPVEPDPAPEPAAAPDPAPETVPAETPAPVAAGAPVAAAVAVAEPVEEDEAVEAVPLGERIRRSSRAGAVAGLVLGLLVALFAAQWLLPRATTIDVDGAPVAAVDVVSGWLIAGYGLLSAVIGVVVAGSSRLVTGWLGRGMRLVGSGSVTGLIGAVTGLVVGAAIAALILGSGTPNDLIEGVTTVPVLGSLLWSMIGWAAGGWLIGTLVQALGVPVGVETDEAEESVDVRSRLAGAYSLPGLAALSILVLVLPVSYVFISYPAWAPLVAIFISAAILGFAGLSASRPGMKITAGEFLLAAAGVGVIVVIIAAVLSAQGAGHHEDEEGHEATAVLVVT